MREIGYIFLACGGYLLAFPFSGTPLAWPALGVAFIFNLWCLTKLWP